MTYNKKSIEDVEIKAGQKVFVRCDFNVPMEDGRITDDKRLVDSLPTITKLIQNGGKVILCSHFGKPKGVDPSLSLEPVAKRLSELLEQEVAFADDDYVAREKKKNRVAKMADGDVLLLFVVLIDL